MTYVKVFRQISLIEDRKNGIRVERQDLGICKKDLQEGKEETIRSSETESGHYFHLPFISL